MQGDIVITSDRESITVAVDRNPDADTLAPVTQTTVPSQNKPTPEPEQPQASKDVAEVTPDSDDQPEQTGKTYVLNTNTKKFHKPSCYHVEKIIPENYEEYVGTASEVEAMGYVGCKTCKPF